jgi:hypothetical protein
VASGSVCAADVFPYQSQQLLQQQQQQQQRRYSIPRSIPKPVETDVEAPVRLVVRTLSGLSAEIELPGTARVGDLQEAASAQLLSTGKHTGIVFEGQIMPPQATLHRCGLRSGATVFLFETLSPYAVE